MNDAVLNKLDTLPTKPGVYLFVGHDGSVIYVGKARSLRQRVRSYFQPGSGDGRYFIALLDDVMADLRTIVVDTEKEAALLENQLIKEHRPRFNVRLRDDKEFLSLRLNTKAKWARLEVVRRPKADGARYFGPYDSATAARKTLRLANRHFQLRTCTDSELRSRTRPCLQYQIKRCLAPCVYAVDGDEYQRQLKYVGLFLDGRHDDLVHELQEKMDQASGEMDYERAAAFRDQMYAVDRVREGQKVAAVRGVDQDVVGLHRQADQAEVAVIRVRHGKVVGVHAFGLKSVSLPDSELISSFLGEYYAEGMYVPNEIILPEAVEAQDGVQAWLSDRAEGSGAKVRVVVPKRGERVKLLRMARDNAEHSFHEKQRAQDDVKARLGEIQRRLQLPVLPRRMECIDISHTGGDDTVAAIVSVLDAAPERERYRVYHIKSVCGGDDYGAMREALERRFSRAREGQGKWSLPDLLVVDGGKGQLNAALRVVAELHLDLSVVALAKEKERPGPSRGGARASGDAGVGLRDAPQDGGDQVRVFDRVYLPGAKNAINLRDSSPALQVLAMARDEAHRFSNLHRLKLRRKKDFSSELDVIKGVGPKTRTALLKGLGSMEHIRQASFDELRQAGATERQARNIIAHFGTPTAEEDAVNNAFR